VRGREDAESWSTVVLEGSRLKLWVSDPDQIAAVALDMFSSDLERIVFGVSRVDRDLCVGANAK